MFTESNAFEKSKDTTSVVCNNTLNCVTLQIKPWPISAVSALVSHSASYINVFLFTGHPRICHRGNIRTSDCSCYPGINMPQISTILISGNLGAVQNKHWRQDSLTQSSSLWSTNGDVHCTVLVRINLWIWVEFVQCVLCCTLKRIVWLMRLSQLCHTLSQIVKKTDMLSLEKMGETFVVNNSNITFKVDRLQNIVVAKKYICVVTVHQ